MWSNVKENFWMVSGTDAPVIQAPGEFLHPGHPWLTPEAEWAGVTLPTLLSPRLLSSGFSSTPFPEAPQLLCPHSCVCLLCSCKAVLVGTFMPLPLRSYCVGETGAPSLPAHLVQSSEARDSKGSCGNLHSHGGESRTQGSAS